MARFKKFTDVNIKALRTEGKRSVFTEGEGLYLEVSPKGKKAWKHLYKVAGKNRWHKLGDYPTMSLAAARKENHLVKANTDRGRAPVGLEGLNRNSPFLDLYKEWSDKAVDRKGRPWSESTKRNVKGSFEADVLPTLRGYKLKDIHRADIQALLDTILARGANTQALQVYRRLSRLLNYAAERGYIEVSPMVHLPPAGSQNKKDRHLSAKEIKTFLDSLPCADMTTGTANALELILRTGQRPSEVCGATAKEMHGDWWVIPGERTKNKLEQRVPLTETTKKLFGAANKHGFYFPSPKDEEKPVAAASLSKALRRSLTGGEKSSEGREITIPIKKPFCPHDLRRTCATFLAELGFMDEVIGAILNHKKQTVTGIYNRYRYDKEKQKALQAWERRLKTILTAKESNVVPMVRKSKGA